MTDCILVDIDGTLADTRHRLHYLQKKPKDWKSFFDAMVDDPPHQYIVDLVNMLAETHPIFLVSGRPESHLIQTKNWLQKNQVICYENIYMRKEKDYRPDTIIKKEFLEDIRSIRMSPKFAIDDRPDVVRMWRENGVPCLQVDDRAWYEPFKGDDPLDWLNWMQTQHQEPMFKKAAEELEYLRRSLQNAIILSTE